MKTLLLSAAAAIAVVAISPALAQTAPQTPPATMMKPMTRTEVVQKVQDHFAMLDTNKDGFVTKAEIDSAKSARHERRADHREQRGDAMFDRMDSNHDGSVTRAEFDASHEAMAARMGQGGQMGGHRMGMRMMRHGGMGAHLLAMADADKDGRVSLQEATTAAAAHFDSADANHDGTLTPDEMRAAHQAMRGKASR